MASRKGPRAAAGAAPAAKARKTGGKKGEGATTGGVAVATRSQVVSSEQIQEAIDRVIAKADANAAALKTSTGTNLSLSKEIAACAKTTGFEKGDIKWALGARQRTPEEIDAETRRRTRIAGYFKMKIGGQLGLLEDGSSVISQTEREADKDNNTQVLAACEAQGFEAGKAGATLDNPYPAGSKRAARYGKGWNLGQKEIAEGLKSGSAKAATHEPAHA